MKNNEIELDVNDEKRKIWLNGKILNFNEANISVLSPATQFGISVFEGIRCYWNSDSKKLYGFRLHDHFKRLMNSAKIIEFNHTYSIKDFYNACRESIIANNYKEDITLRQTLLLDGFGSFHSKDNISMFAAPIARGRMIDETKKKGLTCKVSSWQRISDRSLPPRVKIGANYVNSRFAHLDAVKDGYDTSLMLNDRGTISESPGACVFIVREGLLITPPLTSSILESITRDTVIQIAQKILNITVIEREIDRTELYIADEVFLAGTSFEIVPIISIDRFIINTGEKGILTKEIMDKYFEIVRGNNKDFLNWIEEIY
ncbi:MAG: branched-chain-amino-acid transaminase [Tenericutes bacterium GWC2_34_14]|nr:MAG: branched-chain-amino-acid transaminase [Tenericutes bacterium GWC2_34_14]OHE34473.1 MAG: branched-chain-amino-acid transaminase [Tenericutes bacterium GWE2_34_108]OHE35829.1 MAG: branched-chain-amino-acid transaminase [Tenericutes bacterium GWF1_35_14]OHE39084.1 MAG: branched-chain-amino-acid transaminase [Tenericutes bacterium GWF2_35_184]OHE42849.1 MAG: branched-chain-amino-acid transaminase [Tenericutes bacterium RIFOXYA2_FULL_36_32]OHE44029.1 MAG: branched-chain-amino-acid transami